MCSITLRRHCLPQMCALLQPLRDNMAQCSSFVQVIFPDFVNVATSTTTVWLIASPFYYEFPSMLISNTFLLAFCDLYVHINRPLILHLSRLQDVSDIADIVLARSRTAFSVRIQPFSFRHQPRRANLRLSPLQQLAFASSTQQHLPAGEREAILSKI